MREDRRAGRLNSWRQLTNQATTAALPGALPCEARQCVGEGGQLRARLRRTCAARLCSGGSRLHRSDDVRPCRMVTQRKRGAVPTRSCMPAAISMLERHAAALWKGRRLFPPTRAARTRIRCRASPDALKKIAKVLLGATRALHNYYYRCIETAATLLNRINHDDAPAVRPCTARATPWLKVEQLKTSAVAQQSGGGASTHPGRAAGCDPSKGESPRGVPRRGTL